MPRLTRRTAAPPSKRRKGGTGRLLVLRLGIARPRGGYPAPRIGSISKPVEEPKSARSPYVPSYFSGPPAYGNTPNYPYAWAPPIAMIFW